MTESQSDIRTILIESGCLSFLDEGADQAFAQIERNVPAGWKYLSDDSLEDLRSNYRERMNLIYTQVVMAEVQRQLGKHDPVGVVLGKLNPEPVKLSVQDLMAQTDGNIQEYLHTKYPLLAGYRQQLLKHYVECFSDFLQAFLLKREEIQNRFLEGRPIQRITHLSTGGADIHRNGRCVIGVTTDTGKFYYKPHDCGLDVLYHRIVQNWFSDCTVAADVIEGILPGASVSDENKYAFVSCLKHEPVSKRNDISRYYYHFGILTALFHGLGSTDMHMENIISCADNPAAVDMETLLGTALRADEEFWRMEKLKAQREVSESLMRTCLLPVRTYKGPLHSPLYVCREGNRCLPEYQGEFQTVEGFENEYIQGFREGYGRMLKHRAEIEALIEDHKEATVRCIVRNTSFYYLIRQMLFLPEYLTDEKAREKVYAKLCSPYTVYGEEPEKETTQYEWQCMLKGDIPYYCTTVAGKDLCGEDPGQTVAKDYYATSVLDSAVHFLYRLSAQEEAFELDLLRVMFDHAPTDDNRKEETEPIAKGTLRTEILRQELTELFCKLKADAICCTDGNQIWMSTAESLEMTESFGSITMLGNIGAFAARITATETEPEIAGEALDLAGTMGKRITQILDQFDELEIKENKLYLLIPTGLYAGLGGAILACHEMEQSCMKEASGLAMRVVRFGLDHQLYRYKKIHTASGAAGLILALSALDPSEEVKELSMACAERVLEEKWPDRADLPYGLAGIGAALAGAFDICGDPRFFQGAVMAFRKVQDLYKPDLLGWPDGSARLKFMADKGPHAAGIYLAAAYAKEKLSGMPEAKCPEDTELLLDKICMTALGSLAAEKTLYREDSLDQGNALTVLALLKAGEKTHAEKVLSAMLKRKGQKGCFTVTPAGIRSAFDPSYYMGTLGISYAMMEYLSIRSL